MWTGVVSFDGLILKGFNADPGFMISKRIMDDNSIEFDFTTMGDNSLPQATILLSPHFFSWEQTDTVVSDADPMDPSSTPTTEEMYFSEFPENVAQVSVGTYGWKPGQEQGKVAGSFILKVSGPDDFSSVSSRFGFNFLV